MLGHPRRTAGDPEQGTLPVAEPRVQARVSGPDGGPDGRARRSRVVRSAGPPLLAVAATFAALGALYLFPYAGLDFRYPAGWDAAANIEKIRLVADEGLARRGTIRVAGELVAVPLMAVTRQNAFTMTALVPAVLAGVAGLGAAAMARAGLGIRPLWVPVIGFMTWAAFGHNGIMTLHFDNLMNVALVLPALASAVAFVAWGRGAVAAAVLLMASGLAHWPFYVFALGAFGLATLGLLAPAVRGEDDRAPGALVGPLVGAAAASAAFVGVTFLDLPDTGRIGARLGVLRAQLRRRFLASLDDAHRYLAVPLALLGALGTWLGLSRGGPGREPAVRPVAGRFFLLLMLAWVGLTVVAGIAQFAGLPTAGARLLLFLFPVGILAGVGLWWAGRWLHGRLRRPVGTVLGALVVLAAMAGFGLLSGVLLSHNRPRMSLEGSAQIAASEAYTARYAPTESLVYLLSRARTRSVPSWFIIRATLSPEVAGRAVFYYGPLSGYGSGRTSLRARAQALPPEGDRVSVILRSYHPAAFAEAAATTPERVIAPGVVVVEGPLPVEPLPPVEPPSANTGLPAVVWVPLAVIAILAAAGGGWSLALLPADPVVRTALAPALGVATVALAGLVWDRVGLPLGGGWSVAPLGLSAAAGWGTAGWVLLRSRER